MPAPYLASMNHQLLLDAFSSRRYDSWIIGFELLGIPLLVGVAVLIGGRRKWPRLRSRVENVLFAAMFTWWASIGVMVLYGQPWLEGASVVFVLPLLLMPTVMVATLTLYWGGTQVKQ